MDSVVDGGGFGSGKIRNERGIEFAFETRHASRPCASQALLHVP